MAGLGLFITLAEKFIAAKKYSHGLTCLMVMLKTYTDLHNEDKKHETEDRIAKELINMRDHAIALINLGKINDGLVMLHEFLQVTEQVYDEDDPHTIEALDHIASIMTQNKAADIAKVMYEKSLERQVRVFGPEDPRTNKTREELEKVEEMISRQRSPSRPKEGGRKRGSRRLQNRSRRSRIGRKRLTRFKIRG
jgi:hypothetical protein